MRCTHLALVHERHGGGAAALAAADAALAHHAHEPALGAQDFLWGGGRYRTARCSGRCIAAFSLQVSTHALVFLWQCESRSSPHWRHHWPSQCSKLTASALRKASDTRFSGAFSPSQNCNQMGWGGVHWLLGHSSNSAGRGSPSQNCSVHGRDGAWKLPQVVRRRMGSLRSTTILLQTFTGPRQVVQQPCFFSLHKWILANSTHLLHVLQQVVLQPLGGGGAAVAVKHSRVHLRFLSRGTRLWHQPPPLLGRRRLGLVWLGNGNIAGSGIQTSSRWCAQWQPAAH